MLKAIVDRLNVEMKEAPEKYNKRTHSEIYAEIKKRHLDVMVPFAKDKLPIRFELDIVIIELVFENNLSNLRQAAFRHGQRLPTYA
jgi:hypothetical protein